MKVIDENSGESVELTGAPVVMIWHKTLAWAVDELAKLGQDELKFLKIRAGEHLAAILTTSFFHAAPLRVDTAGGPDLLFGASAVRSSPFPMSPDASQVVFEIKSLPGQFREFDSMLNRTRKRGAPALGSSIPLQVQSARGILEKALPRLVSAQENLVSKLKGAGVVSKNLFLVVHPLDAWAVELKHPVLGPFLPELGCLKEIDSVWILWSPERLTMWSQRRPGWTDLMFTGMNEDEIPHPSLTPLQEAEVRFLEQRGKWEDSPYLFGIADG